MKKIFVLILTLIFTVLPLTACGGNDNDAPIVLRVSNCEDYIDENICAEFEEYMAQKGQDVVVEYSTFGTPENLYNDLRIAGGYIYDIICPSDYMIEKMAREGMLTSFEEIETKPTVYMENVSPYIKEVFESVSWGDESLATYAAGYMWGTMGLVYNPIYASHEDMQSWYSLWDSKYAGKMTIKDSVRDSYFIGLAYACREELESLDVNSSEYRAKIQEIFNRTDKATAKKAEEGLKLLKKNIYGFEVDSGKNDLITGKIAINFAWSGDAVYCIYEAGEGINPVELCYSVPKEGSNVWFDGWVIPKYARQKDLAVEFINFLSMPENAIKNMEFTGYTSVISGANGEIYDWAQEYYGVTETADEENSVPVELGYFFGSDSVLYSDSANGMFATQFPDSSIINRCAVMHYFDGEANQTVNKMWENVKGESLPIWAIIVIGALALAFVIYRICYRFRDKLFTKCKGRKKSAKVISKELIK